MEKAQPTAEEVVARLKDDGDFDGLRVKIIRKVKENEELRNNIVMEVKQSILLNNDDADYLKPRQLSDAIYKEIGSKIMGQISDELWKVIRSDDSMKTEIKETVELVYKRMINPESQNLQPDKPQPSSKKKTDQSSFPTQGQACGKDNINPPSVATSTCETIATADAVVSNEPPGFAPSDPPKAGDFSKNEPTVMDAAKEMNDELPPGFFLQPFGGSAPPSGAIDEDPDVPPGFG